MKCKVISIRGDGKPNEEIGDQLIMCGREANALRAGEVTATMRHATIDGILHNGVSIEGFVPTGDGKWMLQRWWCSVGDDEEGAK